MLRLRLSKQKVETLQLLFRRRQLSRKLARAARFQRLRLEALDGRLRLGFFEAHSGEVFRDALRQLGQPRIVEIRLVIPAQSRDPAVHHARQATLLVLRAAELAFPQIREQRITLVGLALFHAVGLRKLQLLLGPNGNRARVLERRLQCDIGRVRLHGGLGLAHQRLISLQRGIDSCLAFAPVRLCNFQSSFGHLNLAADPRDERLVIFQQLGRPALGRAQRVVSAGLDHVQPHRGQLAIALGAPTREVRPPARMAVCALYGCVEFRPRAGGQRIQPVQGVAARDEIVIRGHQSPRSVMEPPGTGVSNSGSSSPRVL